jgi:hypothetical protein
VDTCSSVDSRIWLSATHEKRGYACRMKNEMLDYNPRRKECATPNDFLNISDSHWRGNRLEFLLDTGFFLWFSRVTPEEYLECNFK